MAREKYAACPIYHKDVLFTDSKENNIGQSICAVEGLYCKEHECSEIMLEPPQPIKRDNLSLQQMFGFTFDVVIPFALKEM
ncbi:hypothetical protein D4Q76_00750 [archaeon]|nr:MAG: hypothetical protein D4Q76_00750 [archaeon]